MMHNYKLLILLLALVLFVNYVNYIMPDRDKLHNKIELLAHKIAKEKKLGSAKVDPKQLVLPYNTLFYDGKRWNYSQAMGDFQEHISKSAEDGCVVKRLKWAQVPLSTKWYNVLKIDTALECKPKAMFRFVNNLRSSAKLYNMKNFTIYKMRNKPMLQLHLHLISYRTHDEK